MGRHPDLVAECIQNTIYNVNSYSYLLHPSVAVPVEPNLPERKTTAAKLRSEPNSKLVGETGWSHFTLVQEVLWDLGVAFRK